VGRGGIAEVYLVTERSFSVQQALEPLVDVDQAMAQRLFREGRAQYLVQHPNILRVFSSLTVEDRPAPTLPLTAHSTERSTRRICAASRGSLLEATRYSSTRSLPVETASRANLC